MDWGLLVMKSSTRITIPFMTGVRGCIQQYPFTRKGNELDAKINWITPIEVQFPDGWSIFDLKIAPTLISYVGEKNFEVWDKRQLNKPRLIGTVNINCDTGIYEVNLDQRYHSYRLSMILLAHHTPQEPFYTNALRNQTPYGEWRYKDVV